MRNKNCLFFLVIVTAGVCLVISAVTIALYSYNQRISAYFTLNAPAAQPSPYLAHLAVCPECIPAGRINIWTNPDRRGIAGQVPSNSEILVLGTQDYNGILHYHIRYGKIDGWVSYLMIQK